MIENLNEIPEEELFTGGHLACKGCSAVLGLKLITKALGSETIVVNASGCMTLLCIYPSTPLKISWFHSAIENAASTASGVVAALKRLDQKKNVVCYAGDGATYDIGMQALSGMLERREPIIYVCYNNESYGNTGVQRSSATPYGAWTTTTPTGRKNLTGTRMERKPMAKIVAAHGAPYVATACTSYPLDFVKKVQKASLVSGPAFIDLLTPCSTGWGFDPKKTVEIGKLAVRSGMWTLYEVVQGKFALTYKVKDKKAEEYLKAQRRFKHLSGEEISRMQAKVDSDFSLLEQGRFWE